MHTRRYCNLQSLMSLSRHRDLLLHCYGMSHRASLQRQTTPHASFQNHPGP